MNTEMVVPEARQLTPEEYAEWTEQAFQDEQAIKAGLRNARAGLWQAAEALYRFSETSGWAALGHESLGDWLADPEITMSRSTYFRMVEAHRELVVLRHSPNVGTLDLTKVGIALPALKRGAVTLEEVLSDVESLGARDLREKYGLRSLPSGAPADSEQEQDFTNGDGGERLDEATGLEDFAEEEQSGTIERGVAVTLATVLEEINRALPPERKALSWRLREQMLMALSMAVQAGLLDG